jgi:hypothetical protein
VAVSTPLRIGPSSPAAVMSVVVMSVCLLGFGCGLTGEKLR